MSCYVTLVAVKLLPVLPITFRVTSVTLGQPCPVSEAILKNVGKPHQSNEIAIQYNGTKTKQCAYLVGYSVHVYGADIGNVNLEDKKSYQGIFCPCISVCQCQVKNFGLGFFSWNLLQPPVTIFVSSNFEIHDLVDVMVRQISPCWFEMDLQ